MNKRQKKKLFKQTLIKVRKLHPNKGEVICLQPNLECVDMGVMIDFMNLYKDEKVFDEATLAIVPANIKNLENKQEAQIYVDKLQSIVDLMKEF